jgi:stress-induced morphogen
MPMLAQNIVELIKAALPDAEVTIQDLVGDRDHYAVTVKSASFEGKTKIQQHQMVYKALGDHMGTTLHAMSLTTISN